MREILRMILKHYIVGMKQLTSLEMGKVLTFPSLRTTMDQWPKTLIGVLHPLINQRVGSRSLLRKLRNVTVVRNTKISIMRLVKRKSWWHWHNYTSIFLRRILDTGIINIYSSLLRIKTLLKLNLPIKCCITWIQILR